MVEGSEKSELRQTLVDRFSEIEVERMEGIPILNKDLRVEAIGFDCHAGYHTGIIITPWFMNLMLLPNNPKDTRLQSMPTGSSHNVRLPAGSFEFIVAQDEKLGPHLTCSLFSPMFEFANQDAARQTAEEIYKQIMTANSEENEQPDPDDSENQMRAIWAGQLPETSIPPQSGETARTEAIEQDSRVSRRDFFRGNISSKSHAKSTL